MKRLAFFAALAVVALATAGSPVQAQFLESFETPIPNTIGAPPGATIVLPSGNWFIFNNSVPIGISGVFTQTAVLVPPTPPGGGTQHAAMNFQNGAGLAVIDTFFMTPTLSLNNGDQLSFWSRTVDPATFPDRLRLRLSTAGASTNIADFSTVLLSINEGLTTTGYPTAWTQFTATLSGLSPGASGRFAFAYQMPNAGPSGANSDYIGLDLVQFTPVPEPTSLALLGVPALALAWKRRRAKAAA